MLKIKEEFDYKSLSRKLEIQLDKLIAENERQQKAFDDEVERINLEAHSRISEVERNFADALEVCAFLLYVILKKKKLLLCLHSFLVISYNNHMMLFMCQTW